MTQKDEPSVLLLDEDSFTTYAPLRETAALTGTIGDLFSSATGSAAVNADVTVGAGPGIMRLGASGTTSVSWNDGAWTTRSTITSSYLKVEWHETFMVTVPGGPQPGRQLIINALLNIDGGLTFAGSQSDSLASNEGSSSSYRLVLTSRDQYGASLFGSGFVAGQQSAWSSPNATVVNNPLPDALAVRIVVNESQIASMRFTAEMTFDANSGPVFSQPSRPAAFTTGTFAADFSHTIAWGGITSIVDASSGLPVEGWSMESASGLDYTNAIPEPASLAAVAAAGLALLRRRGVASHCHEGTLQGM
jgi:hypothetical protein